MNKLSNDLYKRLVAQAQEAKELKLTKLAENVLGSVGSMPRDEEETFIFSYTDLKENVHRSLWKIAIDVVAYHDMKKSDIQKIESVVEHLTDQVLEAMEISLNSLNKVGPAEPKVLGQS